MKRKKSGRTNSQSLVIALALLFCLCSAFYPSHSYAGLFDWLFHPKDTKKSEAVKPASQTFTISKIEPVAKDFIKIIFSEKCDANELRGFLKILPPPKIQWHESHSSANEITIKGEFKAGQEYAVMLTEKADCKGTKYVKTVSGFRMPDLASAIIFSENDSVVERDSRQMIHADITNVDELLLQGVRIPPVLAPWAMNEMKTQFSFEKFKEAVDKKYALIKNFLTGRDEMKDFLVDIKYDRQLFFPDKEPNKANKISIPLGFREEREKGAVELISLKSSKNNQKAEPANRLFRITDFGISYKISKDSLLIWITSLNSGKPVENISVIAFLKDLSIVPLGRTDEHGLVLINYNEVRSRFMPEENKSDSVPVPIKDISFIAVASPSDSSFVEIKQNGTIKPDWITQAKAPDEKIRLLKGHVFTERGIYRPGEKVYFKGTLREYRDGKILPPTSNKVLFTIMNSKDEEIYRKEIVLSDFGTASDNFEIKSYFPLGTYTLNMQFAKTLQQPQAARQEGFEEDDRWDGGRRRRNQAITDNIITSTFEVQEFRAPRHFVEISFKKEKKKDESFINLNKETELLICNISGSYYAGGPVKHGKVRWKIYYTDAGFARKEFPEFSFGTAEIKEKELIESGESILDEKGNLSVTLPLSKDISSGLHAIEFVATVLDFDGRASSDAVVYQEEPEYLIGINRHEEGVKAGDSQMLKAIVIDRKGNKIESGSLDVSVMKKEYMYVRKRNEDGNIYWEDKEVYRKQISTALSIERSIALFDFDFLYGGDYVIQFTYKDKAGREYSSNTKYHVYGYFYGYEYESKDLNFEKMSVASDKKEYSFGETIKVYLNPHKKLSSILMTIEREGILQHRTLNLSPGQKYVEVPVENSFAPNVYISFLGIVPREDFPSYTGQFDETSPGFLFGVVNVEIRKEIETLKIEVNKEDFKLKFEPGNEVTLKLSSADKSGKGIETEMAVCVVDESVLALTGFKTPSLETLLKFISPLSVFTGELRSELLKQTPYGFIRNERLTGGDGGGGVDFSSGKTRKDFRPVAFFDPFVRTDKNGYAEVKFTLPDTMTTYRVYVVACDKGSRFASVKRDLLVVKDFYFEPGIPRFFTKGDRFRFYVSAFNKTDQAGTGRFNLKKDALVNISTPDEYFKIKGFDRTLLAVRGEALKPGISTLAFTGDFEEKKDAVEIKIPVRSGFLSWNDVVFGTVKNQDRIGYKFPEGTSQINWSELNPDEVKALLTISGSPFLKMSKALRYLLHYPYGCVEQTSSGIIPLAGLRGLIKDGLIADMTSAETDKFLKPGIERLLSMQTNEGGFGYWPGDFQTNMWGTIYASSALTQARLAGLEIPSDKMDKAIEYLKKAVKEEGKNDATFRGFASYILSMNNALDESIFREIYRDIKNMPREGALLLMLAAKKGNHLPAKEIPEITKTLLEKNWDYKGQYSFYARYREPAISLIAGSTILRDDMLTGRLVKELLSGINKHGIWTSTSDTGWALIALGEYYKGKSFLQKPVRVTIMQEGWPETSFELKPADSYSYPLEPLSFLKKPEIYIKAEGDSDLVYMLSLTFPRVDYAANGYAKGFKIHKTIENTDGSKTIRTGDVVKVKINIEADDSYEYVVLDDPLPAGLVAINTAIKTEEKVGNEDQGTDEDGYWNYWDSEGGFFRFTPNHFEMRDDRVLAFRDRLWRGNYQYSYYARAVCEGEFIMPSTKIQLMYAPDTASFTPAQKVSILGRE